MSTTKLGICSSLSTEPQSEEFIIMPSEVQNDLNMTQDDIIVDHLETET